MGEKKQYLMAIDQGTSSSRTVIFDQHAKVIASAQQEFPQEYPQPGWVEHDPEAIWQSVLDVTKKALVVMMVLIVCLVRVLAWQVNCCGDK